MAKKIDLSAMASKGGKQAAANMTPEERKKRASAAAEARWGAVPQAHCQGTIKIGLIEIPCAVLEDKKTRLLTQRGMFVSLGRNKNPNTGSSAIDGRPGFLAANNLEPFISDELRRSWNSVRFKQREGSGGEGGNIAVGYRAEILPLVCRVYMDADAAGVLRENQKHIAANCRSLLAGMATAGITGLVDEATGFQYERAHDALAKILEAFIAKELQPYVRTFKPEFYQELFRLRGLKFDGTAKRPQYIGRLTNNLIYSRLAPGLIKELQAKNPVIPEKGRRKHQHHRHLTRDKGHPGLKDHLVEVTALMRASDTWDDFYRLIEKSLPVHRSLGLFSPEFREED